jgi:hypothetical protein
MVAGYLRYLCCMDGYDGYAGWLPMVALFSGFLC